MYVYMYFPRHTWMLLIFSSWIFFQSLHVLQYSLQENSLQDFLRLSNTSRKKTQTLRLYSL